MPRQRVSAFLFASVLITGLTASGAVSAKPAFPTRGCDATSPATTYLAGGPATSRPGLPYPCTVATGMLSQESSVAFSRSGALWYSPAVRPGGNALTDVGLARGTDAGRSWSWVDAAPTGVPDALQNCFCDPALHIDSDTNRIFFFSEDQGFCGGNLSWSDDEGRTWERSTAFGCPVSQDYDVLVTAPPDTSKTTGYRDLLYFCSQGPLIAAGPSRSCVVSTDGGRTARPTGASGGTGLLPAPDLPTCSQLPLTAGHSAVGARDGSVYLPVAFCSDAAVAISRDEGTSWTYVRVGSTGGSSALGSDSLAQDEAGNLYLAWIDARRKVLLATSRDRGLHWTTPVTVTPPGIGGESRVAVAGGRRGQVTVAYYGSPRAGGAVTGYLSESLDGLSSRPTFHTGAVRVDHQPLCAAYDPSGAFALCNSASFSAGNRVDYIGAAYDARHRPWASFAAECRPSLHCVAGSPDLPVDSTVMGVVGTLQYPAASLVGSPPTVPRPPTAGAPHHLPGLAATGASRALALVALCLIAGTAVVLRRWRSLKR
ncbi:MAG: hypothetical protein JWO22_3747 [Frankiales bacterium]|nr:hypothetical protein [Frankiales bacterium]